MLGKWVGRLDLECSSGHDEMASAAVLSPLVAADLEMKRRNSLILLYHRHAREQLFVTGQCA